MIINYDRNPALNTDQKLESLTENIQLALSEVESSINSLKKAIEEIKEGIKDE